jgi:hypothetical protein
MKEGEIVRIFAIPDRGILKWCNEHLPPEAWAYTDKRNFYVLYFETKEDYLACALSTGLYPLTLYGVG